MRILYLHFSHRIKNKFDWQIDTRFGTILFIMLLETNRNFDFLHRFYKKSPTNHFIGYYKTHKQYKSKYYSLWIYCNSVISYPAYLYKFVVFKDGFIHVTIMLRNTCIRMFRSSSKSHSIGVFKPKGALWGWISLCQLSLCPLYWHLPISSGVCAKHFKHTSSFWNKINFILPLKNCMQRRHYWSQCVRSCKNRIGECNWKFEVKVSKIFTMLFFLVWR